MSKATPLFLAIVLASISVFAQQSQVTWTAKLEPSKSFIENRTQFDKGDKLPNSDILFAVDHGAQHIYFTTTGLTYRFDTFERIYPPKAERTAEDEAKLAGLGHVQKEREEKRLSVTTDLIHMKWANADPNVEVVGLEKTHDFHNYSLGEKGSIDNVPAFRKLIYRKVYPNIDVEYVFHPEGGIKYSFILHPGADASQIEMEYSSAEGMYIDASGNVHFPTISGDIIEHAPITFYSDNETEIASRFVLDGNTLKIQLADHDPLRKVVIDPWVQTPTLNNSDGVWECESDATGNAYIIGGEMPMKLLKYSSAGALQWTYNTPYDTANGWLGTFSTDDAGNSYVSNGSVAAMEKVNTGGNQQWAFNAPGFSDEYWTISFNCDQTKLVVGGTTTGGSFLAAAIFDINTSSGSVLNTQVVAEGDAFSFPPGLQEVRSLSASQNSRYYFLTHDTIGAIDANFSPCFNGEPIFKDDTGYDLAYKCENYRPNNGNAGIKAIRANDAFVYTVNGTNVQKRSLANGAVLATANISGGSSNSSGGQNQLDNAGIDIDDCGNVYVGSGNGVYKFTADLNPISSSSTNFSVYDVEVSTNGDVIVAGSTGDQNTVNRTGYVQSFSMGACAPLELICCDPNVCPAGPFCETDPPVTLVAGDPGGTWTGNGITNASTGVFDPSVAGPGTHTIVYTLLCGADSIEIVVSSCIPLEVCLESNGDLTAISGVGPYTWEEEEVVEDCSACLFGCTIPPGCAVNVTQWTQFATGTTVTPNGYPVRVTDTAGDELIITDPNLLPPCTVCTPPTLGSTQVDVACAGGSDGSIDLTVTGNSVYDFDWDNAATTEDISGLSAGDYTVVVTDQNDQNCTATETVTILEGGGPTITGITVTDASCGAADGQIDITATGATQYSIDGGTTFQGTGTFAALAASTYNITIEDANGCQLDTVASVNNANGPTIDNVVSVAPNCGATDGSITITATGATQYSIDGGSTFQSTGSFTALGAGTYDIVVEDATGCQAFDQVVFTIIGAPTIDNIATTDPACGATDGSITITASGGNPPLSYSIDNGLTTQGTGNFTGLTAGTYDIVVNDPSNCPVTQQVTLNSNGGPTIDNVTVTDATCGASDGQIDITASGGVAPLTYSADGGTIFQPGTTFTGLAANNYDIVVQDDTGCQTTQTVTVNNSGAPVITSTNGLDVSCNGVCDGSIAIVAIGATQYSIDGGATFQALPAFTDLCAADYDIVVDDGAGCQSFDQITITEPTAITANAQTTDATCSGMCDGAIAITANGGSAPLTYSIDNGATFQVGTFTNVCDGDYAIVVQDANGCQTALNETVSVPNPITFTFSSTDVSCFGACDGTATVNVQGGTSPYTYNWSGSTATGTDLPAICAGTYSLTITDDAGCSVDTSAFPIIEPPLVAIDNITIINEGCAGDCDGMISIASLGATQYSIDGGLTFTPDPDFTDVCPGIYDLVVQNTTGCEGTGTATVIAGVPVVADFTPMPNVVPELESTIQFANNSSGASIFTWHFGDGTYSSEENPTYDFANEPGTYLVCLSADNGDGCIDTTCNYIDVTPLFTIYVPNAFTPNGSVGTNDVFTPVIRGELNGTYTFAIFDRWGEMIFETNHLGVGWDGTFKDQMVQTGVYTWSVLIEREEGGKNRRYTGHVTLL